MTPPILPPSMSAVAGETFREAVTRLQRAPARTTLERLCALIAPGGRVGRVQRLPGGLQCGTHAVTLDTAGGEPRQLVIRRYTPQQAAEDPGVAGREWQTLRLLAAEGAPAPRPVWLDANGELFGPPTVVMTHLAGRPPRRLPSDLDRWLRQVAQALAAIHRTSIGAATFLSRFDASRATAMLQRPLSHPETQRRIAALPDGLHFRNVLRANWPPPTAASVLLHGDFFTGNILWSRGRLTGVIDWGNAMLGPPEVDLASVCIDLGLLAGPEAASRFLAEYEAASGYRSNNMGVWDLKSVWQGALLIDLWWKALRDQGFGGLSREEFVSRFQALAANALRSVVD